MSKLVSHSKTKPLPIQIGDKYARLTVIAQTPSVKQERRWDCLCDCGNQTNVGTNSLRSGHIRSCGCLQREAVRKTGKENATHGASVIREDGEKRLDPEYQVWSSMRNRCNNPQHQSYKRYGGRGISVCKEWDESYEAFLRDIGPRPSLKHSIDRRNNDGNYEPSNCRWATKSEQSRNTCANTMVTIGGDTRCITEWAELAGLRATTVFRRWYKGCPPERLLEPLQRKRRQSAG